MRALARCYEPAMLQIAERLALPGRAWNLLIVAHTFAPDPISVRRLLVRSAYTSPAAYSEPLSSLQQAGLLLETGPGAYSLTESGRTAVAALMEAAYDRMATLAPLPAEDLAKIGWILHSLVEESLLAHLPVSKWSLICSRRLDLSPPSAVIAKIDQYLSDLGAFRDDAHIASWRHHPVSGHSWDILTVIWRNPGCTLQDVAAQLSRREWSPGEDEEAVAELQRQGWLAGSDALTLTPEGSWIREAAEEATDRYFFQPWSSLSADKIGQLGDRLAALAEALQQDCA